MTNLDEDCAMCPLAIQAWPLGRCLSNSQSTFHPCNNVSEMEIEALRFEPKPMVMGGACRFSLPLHSTSSTTTQSHTGAVISSNLPGIKAVFQTAHLSLWTSSSISQSFIMQAHREAGMSCVSMQHCMKVRLHQPQDLPSAFQQNIIQLSNMCSWETVHNGSMFKLGLAGHAKSARL